jgi:ubiquinone/menaquinone biosynthesis C-methylase UbiE
VDYDRTSIPPVYDRARDHGRDVLDLWMRVIRACVDGQATRTILDLGCGTGRFSAGLAHRFSARVVGVDPSEEMLEQARRKRDLNAIHYARGTAEAIPLLAGTVDMIFMSMSFHHFDNPGGRRPSAAEC